MGRILRRIEEFRIISFVATIISAVLWILAAQIGISSNNLLNTAIVGCLDVIAMIVASEAARKEGFTRATIAAYKLRRGENYGLGKK